jgi:hypothetical protein
VSKSPCYTRRWKLTSPRIDFFASPIVEEREGISKFGPKFDMLSGFEDNTMDPMFNITTLLYSEAFNRARNIYLQRATSLLNEETEQRLRILTDDLKDLLFQLDPTAQGAHALVWPYFVVTAESREIGFRHYFRDKLQYIWETTGYRNVQVAIGALPEIWRKQKIERWDISLDANKNGYHVTIGPSNSTQSNVTINE